MDIKDKASEGVRQIKEEAKVIQGEKSKDKQYTSSRVFADEEASKTEFPRCVKRLFDVNAWSEIPGVANATFELHSAKGEPLKKTKVETGDFIKIDLPGPLPFFWVKVNEVSDGDGYAQFTVQPSFDPTDDDGKRETDHFFRDKARSIFRVERHAREIIAMEVGINEAINNQGEEAGEKALINTLVSEGGWAGFQKHQWKNLTDYLVGKEEKNT